MYCVFNAERDLQAGESSLAHRGLGSRIKVIASPTAFVETASGDSCCVG